jgi:uncharacterized SAM-binding protein YcdF (DUF218 family)
MRKSLLLAIASVLVILLLAYSGRFLVIDRPLKSDVIVVLAGETEKRPELGLELLRQGIAGRLILDVPAQAKLFQWSELELAQQYVQALPEAKNISVCAVYGLSTKAETQDVSRCLNDLSARRILIVTSDHHTRRALITFEKEVPAYNYSVAAAHNSAEFGTKWWIHREWAKTYLNEWARLVWWEVVDRWY